MKFNGNFKDYVTSRDSEGNIGDQEKDKIHITDSENSRHRKENGW